MEKYIAWARFWGSIGAGALTTLRAYRIYVASVLLFVGQLEDPPPQLQQEEAQALKKMVRGPKDWITAECAHELKSLGFNDQLTDLPSILTASKARAVEWEADGRLRVVAPPADVAAGALEVGPGGGAADRPELGLQEARVTTEGYWL